MFYQTSRYFTFKYFVLNFELLNNNSIFRWILLSVQNKNIIKTKTFFLHTSYASILHKKKKKKRRQNKSFKCTLK